ncbi:MAG: tryptophan--tRNA ligase [Candidatus Zambryskibacteria bacterium RIFCSPLOWO2_02_FULL_51_21]|uniref:Tryptophan--tRNA ligase n=1 Tax=Candidatus Zambryskibacteria bacterium RIFCSPHIGHO2_02_FULL_43_37 TaxID=1802749 RepID=A0A1G2TGX8_9BACT|nr:MAG: tryptophan--tRNA ligase [Candidatus Zambryskibacteria bacterium RIFCSPHIGHO2_01_FULL_52_18]OHA96556.1 MAG: tryptophan--tRNA ligase [Candidatus Zambryskibacteria bacterium RIFCSPHIGHO2_02_FULL_43_37]OHB07541.1 MAG: tryptophan--tRNA ligase [Candidatus Zambryskibacteria bacterium RIFCSPLOWO2_01_FULL_52_12]OHB11180.1 MAG: tryptophan--tRNA ligase [Candidatus Zambryskibacteria bacterium RIFCSPLOWO2_02_FULL_51_21]
MASKKILLSGVKPTGRPHVGNYFGAMKQFVELQNEFESYIFIADLHALTTVQNKEELEENTAGVLLDYMAIGLDPKNVTIYKQSDVPQVAELAWIFNCLTTVPYLERAHAYKDAIANKKEPNVGLFDYPILMAADILIQDTDVVPVGQDQKQHVEIARDTAQKFNNAFGETFKLPDVLILDQVATVPGTDGRKMSKSYGNTIPLFATDEEIEKAVMSIVTDSKLPDEPKDPEKDNVFALHKLFTEGPEFAELRDRYEAGKIGYKESKEILIKNIKKVITPMRERRQALEEDKQAVLEVLKSGGKTARERAEKKMEEVRKLVGLKLY